MKFSFTNTPRYSKIFPFRDAYTQDHTQLRKMNEEMRREEQKQWDKESDEKPRDYPKSPEQMSQNGIQQDNLTYLLDTVLEAQDKYVSLYPNMTDLINEQGNY